MEVMIWKSITCLHRLFPWDRLFMDVKSNSVSNLIENSSSELPLQQVDKLVDW